MNILAYDHYGNYEIHKIILHTLRSLKLKDSVILLQFVF